MISRRIIAAVALLFALVLPAHAQKTKAQLNTEIGALFPNNTAGAITPTILRNVSNDIVNSVMPVAPVTDTGVPIFNGTTGLPKDSVILSVPTVLSQPFFGIGDNIADAIARRVAIKMPLVTADRLVNWTPISDQTFSDWTVLAPSSGTTTKYASFASNLSSASSLNVEHMAGLEDLTVWTGSAVLSEQWSFLSNVRFDGSGTVTSRRGVNIQDVLGTGTLTNNYGVYVAPLSRGSTLNYGVYADGTMPNFFGGNLQVGLTNPAAGTNRTLSLQGALSGSGGGFCISFNQGNQLVGNISACSGGAYDAGMLIASSAGRYQLLNLGLGFVTSDAAGHLSVATTIPGSFLPNPSTTTLGGIKSNPTGTLNQWVYGLTNTGDLLLAQPLISNIGGWGTGVAAAAAINIGSAGAPVLFNGAGGTPSSIALTNATALPLSTGVTGFLSVASMQGAPANPTGTTSTTGVMMGMGTTCKITPTYSGRVYVNFTAGFGNTAVTNSLSQARYGTGTAPANGAAPAGTAFGSNVSVFVSVGTASYGISNGGVVTGLSVGTAYWFDTDVTSGSGAGTAALTNVSCSVMEF